jgi:hypothetical protein
MPTRISSNRTLPTTSPARPSSELTLSTSDVGLSVSTQRRGTTTRITLSEGNARGAVTAQGGSVSAMVNGKRVRVQTRHGEAGAEVMERLAEKLRPLGFEVRTKWSADVGGGVGTLTLSPARATANGWNPPR